MDFIEISIFCSLDFRDILMAEMAATDYDSFEETHLGFKAFIPKDNFNVKVLDALLSKYSSQSIRYQKTTVIHENWNRVWEENYDPIFVDEQIVVCAPFHTIKKEYPYKILITPKMSFGTGHHETTRLMLSHQLTVDHQDKKVYDVGCGTGILGILASKLGAGRVSVSDIDEWCVENTKENAEVNHARLEIAKGTLKQLNIDEEYDIVLANINKNILLEEVSEYARILCEKGILIVSGFYLDDAEEIGKEFAVVGLEKLKMTSSNKWASVIFTKTLGR